MKFLNKMERKLGRYAIPNLIKYVLGIYILGTVMAWMFPANIYGTYLSLDIGMVMKGQIWRLVTFIMAPYSTSMGMGLNILWFVIEIYLYYMIGTALENAWGTFRFNLYFFSGMLFNIIAAIIIYIAFGSPFPVGLNYIFNSMFFAFAALYPNMQFLIYFVIPIKVKWLAYVYAVIFGWEVITYFRIGAYALCIAALVAIANFLIFFMLTRNYKRVSPQQIKRRRNFKSQVKSTQGITRHKCAICGRTEQDDPNLEFRFCSKCEGNYEYCSDHLFTHEHVKKH